MRLHTLLSILRERYGGQKGDASVSVASLNAAIADLLKDEQYAKEQVRLQSSDKPNAVIDVCGRVWLDGVQVGYLHREAHVTELRAFADLMGAEFPAYTGDFLKLQEVK